ncbi:MAG TPA: hypothetical protein EYP63_02740 [Desulfotomaculum sp.]|nr:hypothetical protein [Desulfotomaculum sp.]
MKGIKGGCTSFSESGKVEARRMGAARATPEPGAERRIRPSMFPRCPPLPGRVGAARAASIKVVPRVKDLVLKEGAGF